MLYSFCFQQYYPLSLRSTAFLEFVDIWHVDAPGTGANLKIFVTCAQQSKTLGRNQDIFSFKYFARFDQNSKVRVRVHLHVPIYETETRQKLEFCFLPR